ncbi:hypothetical protein MRX96_058139 [Rhipicephalus microplus]
MIANTTCSPTAHLRPNPAQAATSHGSSSNAAYDQAPPYQHPHSSAPAGMTGGTTTAQVSREVLFRNPSKGSQHHNYPTIPTPDAESDICDDEDVSLDDGEDQSDESSSDVEEEKNGVCSRRSAGLCRLLQRRERWKNGNGKKMTVWKILSSTPSAASLASREIHRAFK